MDSLSLVLYVVVFIILCLMLLKIITSRKSLDIPKMTGGQGEPLKQEEFEKFLNKRLQNVVKYVKHIDEFSKALKRLEDQVKERPELKESNQKHINTLNSYIRKYNEKLRNERRKIEYFYNISGVFRYLANRRIYADKLKDLGHPFKVVSIFSYGRPISTRDVTSRSEKDIEEDYGRIDNPDFARMYMTYCDKYDDPIEEFKKRILSKPTPIQTGFKLYKTGDENKINLNKYFAKKMVEDLQTPGFSDVLAERREKKYDDYNLIEELLERRFRELSPMYRMVLPPVYDFYRDFWSPNRLGSIRRFYDDEKVVEVVKKVIAKFLEYGGRYQLRTEDYEDIDNIIDAIAEHNTAEYKRADIPAYMIADLDRSRDDFIEIHKDLLQE